MCEFSASSFFYCKETCSGYPQTGYQQLLLVCSTQHIVAA